MADHYEYGSAPANWQGWMGSTYSGDGASGTWHFDVGVQAINGWHYEVNTVHWSLSFGGTVIGSGSGSFNVEANGWVTLGSCDVTKYRTHARQDFAISFSVWITGTAFDGTSSWSGSDWLGPLDSWSVTYDGNGGSTPDSQTKWYNEALTLAGAPSRAGYGFDGWSGSDGKTYAAGASYTANAAVTLTAKWHQLVTVPGTPAVTATRSSDTSINVTWSLKQPTNGSITSNRIEVKIDEEGWTTISSSLSGSATSYTYSSSSANHRYQFRVASSSSAGQSDYGESKYVYTTPAAPRGAYGLIRGTNVGVTALIDNIKYPSGYEWQRSANGSTGWTNINGAQSSISDTYSGSTAPYYRVRCVGVGGLASAYCPAFQVSKGYNIYVNSAGSTPDKINFYVPTGSSIKSIKILV